MESSEALKKHIDAAVSLKSIVRTMKVLSAVSLRQYEKLVQSAARHRQGVEMGLTIALKDRIREPAVKRGSGVFGIVFGSEMGLCGQFNERVTQTAADDKPLKVMAVGDKTASKLMDAGITPAAAIPYPASVSAAVSAPMSAVLETARKWHEDEPQHEIRLYYNRPSGRGTGFEQQVKILLPVDEGYLASLGQRPWKSNCIPKAMWDKKNLTASLIKGLLYSDIYTAFVDSLAAENAARLASMQAAEKHIDEYLDELNLGYNRARQDAITSELLDIVSGAEAAGGNDE